ncbi:MULTISPECIES: Fe-S biogenesis protein NfuA [unclassified Neptuniibacter]|uniref:Fe-S biogenesis protein NfuA n=1 Tax=unclassified Neptuniibacter TaxID=2630693 RepID=UPI000C4EFD70|nr:MULTISPECIES: Fe-S biogenesis protein NfuA [unclassified Neptuniibacter]MAY42083.1 Fe/S biogenesis protein NfuA [Oceanospirillaceae bacterium]|tara:strand:+ start:26219 stop:26812 length:594 start_codon:yes stop_codon:yes gene_type:complete
MNIIVTEAAEDYLVELLSKQDVEGMAVRMFVTQPGTSYAETCLAYCRPDEIIEDDEVMELSKLRFYIENTSVPYLDEANVDFAKDRMGGQLTIKAPNAKVPKVSPDSPINEQINYILYSEINPGLASHGGEVKLMEVVEEEGGQIAILEFGGGCQGCSAVDMTLKDGVEATLIERIADLVGVRDVTDHSVRENAYYK